MTTSTFVATSPQLMYPIGDFIFDAHQQRLYRGRREVSLRPKSLDVLTYLAKHRGQLISKSELISAVWPDTFVTENSLNQCLTEIRRALGSRWRSSIRTVARRGYLLNFDHRTLDVKIVTMRQIK